MSVSPDPDPDPNPVSNAVPGPAAPGAEEKQWAMFAHLSALIGGLLSGAFGGWGVFIGPLVIWLLKRETMPFVDDQGKEALNFNITAGIVFVVLWGMTFGTFGIGLLITGPLGLAAGIVWLVFTVIATIRASEGTAYRYPVSLRLIK
jgi:uncharacterized Tic20 family protein